MDSRFELDDILRIANNGYESLVEFKVARDLEEDNPNYWICTTYFSGGTTHCYGTYSRDITKEGLS
jgi:hypothetical protein